VDRTDFRENTKIQLLNVSKADLLNDFEDSPEVVKSGLYKQSTPRSTGNSAASRSGHGRQLRVLGASAGHQAPAVPASVASMAHARSSPRPTPSSSAWTTSRSFQSQGHALDLRVADLRQVELLPRIRGRAQRGLVMPRFLLRLPYGEETVPVKEFNYDEQVAGSHGKYLWGTRSSPSPPG